MNWKIDNVDEKSTVQVGSFRIDSSGNQQLREVRSCSLCRIQCSFQMEAVMVVVEKFHIGVIIMYASACECAI